MKEQEWKDYESKVRTDTGTLENIKTVFFRDGVMDEDRFGKNGFRPLFILKEVNDKDGCRVCTEAKRWACTQTGIRVENNRFKAIKTQRSYCQNMQFRV